MRERLRRLRLSRRSLDGILLASAVLSVVAITMGHEDPWLRNMVCAAVPCLKSDAAAFWNKLFYDLGMGTIVSLVFYWLLVRIPDIAKNRRLRHRLTRHHQSMKQEVVIQLLFATKGSASMELVETLTSGPVAFRDYFYADERARWYLAMNKFDHPEAVYFEAVKAALGSFKNEVDFTIDHADIGDDDLFEDLKNLSLLLQDALSRPKDYDGTKSFFGVLQMLVGGWGGGVVGTVDYDRVGDAIARI